MSSAEKRIPALRSRHRSCSFDNPSGCSSSKLLTVWTNIIGMIDSRRGFGQWQPLTAVGFQGKRGQADDVDRSHPPAFSTVRTRCPVPSARRRHPTAATGISALTSCTVLTPTPRVLATFTIPSPAVRRARIASSFLLCCPPSVGRASCLRPAPAPARPSHARGSCRVQTRRTLPPFAAWHDRAAWLHPSGQATRLPLLWVGTLLCPKRTQSGADFHRAVSLIWTQLFQLGLKCCDLVFLAHFPRDGRKSYASRHRRHCQHGPKGISSSRSPPPPPIGASDCRPPRPCVAPLRPPVCC